jgi:DNA-binding transcriptional ArsR family regulator
MTGEARVPDGNIAATTMHALDALGNPVRRQILHTLRTSPLAVGELATRFPVSRPAISRHLRVLEDAGLVEHRAQGARSVYAVRVQGLASVREFLDEFWDTALSQLEELAKE